MKIILNPKYEHLREYLLRLEEHFERDGQEIHRGRNVICTLKVDGLTLCVKRYAPPSLRGRVACRLYKASKGERAYKHPLLLRERGFESPEPIAYVQVRHGFLKSNTYFVCLQSKYRYDLSHIHNLPREEHDEVMHQFARFAARLHSNGFLHRDFTSGNILYDHVKGRYRFSLIDTNSMKHGSPISVEKGCANLAQLTGDDHFFQLLATRYAEERKVDAALCLRLINAAREKRKDN